METHAYCGGIIGTMDAGKASPVTPSSQMFKFTNVDIRRSPSPYLPDHGRGESDNHGLKSTFRLLSVLGCAFGRFCALLGVSGPAL